MIPTAARLSKASRLSLTPKRGNKDFYKGLLFQYGSYTIADASLTQEHGRPSYLEDVVPELQVDT